MYKYYKQLFSTWNLEKLSPKQSEGLRAVSNPSGEAATNWELSHPYPLLNTLTKAVGGGGATKAASFLYMFKLANAAKTYSY